MWKRTLLIILTVVLGSSAVIMIAAQRRPSNLGVTDGKLTPCPNSPNCVSTQAPTDDSEHYIDAISFTGSAEAATDRARLALAELPRTIFVTQEGNYLRFESRTESGIFADDVEIYVDGEQNLVQFRSASRIGYSDVGANRKRMEAFRAAWQALE